MRLFLVGCLLLFQLTGCTRSRPVPVPLAVRVEEYYGGRFPKVPVAFYADGKPVEALPSGESPNRFWNFLAQGTLQGDTFVLPAFTARVHYPCGWKEVSMRVHDQLSGKLVRGWLEKGEKRVNIDVDFPALQESTLIIDIDNRIGAVKTVEVGELSYLVEAGYFPRVDTLVPECENARLKINGEDIAAVPSRAAFSHVNAFPSDGYIFIDPTAKHCYQLIKVTFMEDPYGVSPPEVIETLRGRKMYVPQDRPNYLLEPAPSFIRSNAPYAAEYELMEKKCR